jgi:hypothetical protein
MKKITQIILITVLMLMCFFTTVYATSKDNEEETLKQTETGKILELSNHEAKTIDDFKNKYGSETYGVTAYILDRVRLFSIPLGFILVAVSAIYQYIIGMKKLDVRDKGFNSMIAVITIMIICQILPIVFAIVVTRNQ